MRALSTYIACCIASAWAMISAVGTVRPMMYSEMSFLVSSMGRLKSSICFRESDATFFFSASSSFRSSSLSSRSRSSVDISIAEARRPPIAEARRPATESFRPEALKDAVIGIRRAPAAATRRWAASGVAPRRPNTHFGAARSKRRGGAQTWWLCYQGTVPVSIWYCMRDNSNFRAYLTGLCHHFERGSARGRSRGRDHYAHAARVKNSPIGVRAARRRLCR